MTLVDTVAQIILAASLQFPDRINFGEEVISFNKNQTQDQLAIMYAPAPQFDVLYFSVMKNFTGLPMREPRLRLTTKSNCDIELYYDYDGDKLISTKVFAFTKGGTLPMYACDVEVCAQGQFSIEEFFGYTNAEELYDKYKVQAVKKD